MPFVIAEPCVATCAAACTKVCPMDCIHGALTLDELARVPDAERSTRLAGLQLYIDPDECISCGACVSECPVEAIFDEDELPARWAGYAAINADFFAAKRRA